MLFTVEAVTYKGKRFDLKEKLDRIVSGAPQFLTLTCHSRSLAKGEMTPLVFSSKFCLLDNCSDFLLFFFAAYVVPFLICMLSAIFSSLLKQIH